MSSARTRLSLAKGRLYLAITGPSGGGKSTLCGMLLKKYENLVLSISNTTRKARENEKHGEHYFFISKKEFKDQIAINKMVEWAEVHGNFYGTSKVFLASAKSKQQAVLLDVDVQGVLSFERLFPENTVSIFLHPPNMEELEKRLHKRATDSKDTIVQRLDNARFEIEQGKEFDHQIVNEELDNTFAGVCRIIETEFGVEGGQSS